MSQDDSFFKEDVVEAYLNHLLQEPKGAFESSPLTETDNENAKKILQATKLLEKASSAQESKYLLNTEQGFSGETKSQEDHKEISVQVENKEEEFSNVPNSAGLKARIEDRFQALFFDVAGLTLAVPLTELGGIHQISSITHIVGKPKWFKGVMVKGENKINCVDSAQWVMPEKYSAKIKDCIDYKYLVMLDKSPWGMMSESLINTVELQKSDVKWREDTSKRPWLAGMVKEKMCALVDVPSFIHMLESDATKK
ncbi:chemotaxis protein CheW [Glaciecola sp. KUL10]|uniref:chemotaxis protein CheW n=1 Tax=Glaciecola sp. (strain KUL10) TaxID=2161813 RepID=UPI000D7885F7|nr:chemotaxis protein CheW [Glaciecola sp. KUL10]GBL04024.1 CheW protein [Glaciecola sp. KUL10]